MLPLNRYTYCTRITNTVIVWQNISRYIITGRRISDTVK